MSLARAEKAQTPEQAAVAAALGAVIHETTPADQLPNILYCMPAPKPRWVVFVVVAPSGALVRGGGMLTAAERSLAAAPLVLCGAYDAAATWRVR